MKRILSVLLTLCLLLSLVPVNMVFAADETEYPEITLGQIKLDMAADETVYYQFTPSETGIYRIDSQQSYYDVVGYCPQVYVEIYSEEDDTSYDTGSSVKFRQLEAGETYLLSVRNDSYILDYDNQTAAKAIVVFKMLDYPEIELGKKTTVTIAGDTSEYYDVYENGDHAYFLFKPEKTEKYTFRSFSDVETCGEINDGEHYTDGGYGYYNDERNRGFVAERTLNAGEIYILSAWFYKPEDAGTNSFDVMIEISHDYREEVLTDGTCTTEGTSKFICSHCGDSYTASTSVKHTYVNNYCSACGIKEVYSGICGDNLTWEVDCAAGTLTISGTGEMYNYEYIHRNNPGWFTECTDWGDNARWSSVVIETGITRIGDDAFAGRQLGDVSSLELPNTVTKLGDFSFGWNNSLTSIGLPDSLEVIGNHAFEHCEGMNAIHIPNNVETIGEYAFAGCWRMDTITLGNSIKTIGNQAFGGVAATSIVVPGSVSELGGSVFGYSNLNNIRFEGSAPVFGYFDPVGDGTRYYGEFDGLVATVYYPAGNATWTKEVMQDYGGDITWTAYTAYKVLDDSNTSVVVGKSETAAFHIDASLIDFVGVEVDGEDVAAANYTLTEGSTILTFSAEYLDTLSIGEHSVSVEFADGYAYSQLVISEKGPCADGHTEEVIPGKEATCIESGLTEGKKCSVCGEIIESGDPIPVIDHIWNDGEISREPTVTEHGEMTYTCEVCGETKTEEITPSACAHTNTER